MFNRPACHDGPARTGGTWGRIVSILVIGMIAAAVVSLATNHSTRVAPAPREPMSRMHARQLQAHAADNAVIGGANAAQQAIAAPFSPATPITPRDRTVHVSVNTAPTTVGYAGGAAHSWTPPSTHSAIQLPHVRSDAPHPTREKALADAVEVARRQLAERFQTLDPPLNVVPSAAAVRYEYLRGVTEIEPTAEDRAEWDEAKVGTNRMWVDLNVEVSADQVRQLRSGTRVERAGLYTSLAFVLLAAVYGFLRFDALTKGYLTRGIVVAFAAVVAAVVVLLLVVA